MDRRRFLALAGGALAWPSFANAQYARKLLRIGMAAFPPLSSLAQYIAAFENGLRDEGYAPGKDVLLDYRSAESDPARYGKVVRDLVQSKPDVIVTGINDNTAAVRAETRTIPIVMMVGTDVVAQGFVKSLARPGGNITGLTYDVGNESVAKRFELLKLAVPRTRRVAVLYDPPYGAENRDIDEAAARSLHLQVLRLDITDDFERTFATLSNKRADAVFFYIGARQTARRAEVVAATLKYRLPSNFPVAEFVEAGGLMSYGPNLPDMYRRGAAYVSKILKGAKPEDLPVQQPVKLDLVINLKTAKALGLTIPRIVLLRAERVIE